MFSRISRFGPRASRLFFGPTSSSFFASSSSSSFPKTTASASSKTRSVALGLFGVASTAAVAFSLRDRERRERLASFLLFLPSFSTKSFADAAEGSHKTASNPSSKYEEFHRKDLPTYTIDQVKAHSSRETGVWMTFRGGVYDFTDFVDAHPGGSDRILMSAGNDLKSFWEVYRQHHRGHIVNWMEKYRIGNLTPEDAETMENEMEFANAYEDDPVRSKDLLGTTQRPWCGEPRIELLTNNFFTPNEIFYVRNHLPVPVIDPKEYRLVVKGNGVKEMTFTLDDLKKKFKKYEVVSTLQCAGNRREDFHGYEDRMIFISPHWISAAISNAKWGGCRLRDVLKYCGVEVDAIAYGEDKPGQVHVQFEGYDSTEPGLTYGGSIPIIKAVDPLGDCLLAYEMNGEDLPRDHGYPVRALVPGHAGARQVKWLSHIIVSDKESQRPWHQKSYRGFAPDITFENDLSHWPRGLRLDQAPIVQEMPVQSLVCNPPPNALLGVKNKMDKITVKGVAWSGGGKGINRVDVSIDGGKTWKAAELFNPVFDKQKWNRKWAWFHFEKEFELPKEVQEALKRGEKVSLDVTSKASNGAFDTQPENPAPYYNARGVCINHWFHVPCTLDPTQTETTVPDGQKLYNVPTGGDFRRAYHGHGFEREEASRPKAEDKPKLKKEQPKSEQQPNKPTSWWQK